MVIVSMKVVVASNSAHKVIVRIEWVNPNKILVTCSALENTIYDHILM